MLIFDDAFPPRNARRPAQLDANSQLSIAAEVTKSSILEIKSEPAIEPLDVVAATRKDRSHYENTPIPRGMRRLMERLQAMGGMGY